MPASLHSRFVRTAIGACVLSCAGLASAAAPAPAGELRFPALNSSYLKTGDFIAPDAVRRVRPGLTKDQVRVELGNPHFSEGIFNVREWDYAFNFYTGKDNAFVTCHFNVKFNAVDGEDRVASTHWKGATCEDYLKPVTPAPAVAAVPVAAPAPAPRRYALGADGLFVFGTSALQDLLPDGRAKLDALATQIQRDNPTLSSVVVTGHTDRIGSEVSNKALSQARAATVRDHLVRHGLDARQIRAVGAGESQPVVQCAGERVTPQLVSCPQPNRRVEVEVVGQQ